MKVKIACKFEAPELAVLLKENNIEVVESGEDLIIAYGGDGTVLNALRHGKVLAVRAKGSVGFISDMGLEKFGKAVNNLENFKIRDLPVIEVSQGEKYYAVNDVVLAGQLTRSIRFNVYLNGKVLMDNVIGDGIIVSTSLGSTGYNLSAGGSVILSDCFALTLNNPHSHRKLNFVFKQGDIVELEPLSDCEIVCDGRADEKIIPKKEKVKVMISDKKFYLVEIPGFEEDMYNKIDRLRLRKA